MVAYAKDESSTLKVLDEQIKPVVGCICPKCYRQLYGPALSGERDRYGRITRTYYGWCLRCDYGFEVIQFKQGENRWLIHKYRFFAIFEGEEKPEPVTAWLKVNELPEIAPVVTGPGGQYDIASTPSLANKETIELVETILAALKATVKTVESMLKMTNPK